MGCLYRVVILCRAAGRGAVGWLVGKGPKVSKWNLTNITASCPHQHEGKREKTWKRMTLEAFI
jgi:hypothetical protein